MSDLVAVESGPLDPGRPHIKVGAFTSTAALADVASVTLDYARDVQRDVQTDAANLATAVAITLIRVGQSNLAAQIAAACSASSSAILDYGTVFSLAQAFLRSRRVLEALQLADDVGSRRASDGRLPSMILQTAVLARGNRLTAQEADLSVEVSRRSLRRTEDAGDRPEWAAADAYNLGQALSRKREPSEAIEAYLKAASLDPRYEGRGYFNRELAGLLFEAGRYEESAERYARALAIEDDPFLLGLMGDALLWSGRYAAAQDALDRYVATGVGPEGAEWRLKHRALSVIREMGGDQQQRDPDRAEELITPFDFEAGEDFDPHEALAAYRAALEADACCGRAWFRLTFLVLVLSDGEAVADAFEIALASAVLHRESPGAWNNTIRMVRAAELSDDLARDCLRMAYRFLGAGIATALIESATAAEAELDTELLTMLEEVMREADEADRVPSYTLRIPTGEDEMVEFSIVGEPPTNPVHAAHDPLDLSGSPGEAADG